VALNPYFNNYNYAGEQNLIEDLIIESIKMYGYDMRYMPRRLVSEDQLFGEDILSIFDVAATLEMYIKNVEGFEGEGDFLSRFNLEIRDEITFSVAQKRFDQIKTEKLITQESYNFLQQDGSSLLLQDGNGDNYTITSSRPLEGDLLYFPLLGKLYEIKFVEHEPVFYQMGALQMYDLRCELFEYSSERIDTGVADIDAIEDKYSHDVLFYELLQQDGSRILKQDGDSLLQQYDLPESDNSDNSFIQAQAASGIIDFSESNPFSEILRY
jgi:hypothetical protein